MTVVVSWRKQQKNYPLTSSTKGSDPATPRSRLWVSSARVPITTFRSEKGLTLRRNGTTTRKAGAPTTLITVGKITITLKNWGFTEYRAILILDTYKRVQNELKYAGSRSDFLYNPGADLEANSGLR